MARRHQSLNRSSGSGAEGSESRSAPFVLAATLAGAAGLGYAADDLPLEAVRAMLPGSGCRIKGNVSVTGGERIYHVPGQEYYAETRISPTRGERWFCSEEDARAAGWRRSRI